MAPTRLNRQLSFETNMSSDESSVTYRSLNKEQVRKTVQNGMTDKKKVRFQVVDSAFTSALRKDKSVLAIYSIVVAAILFNLAVTCLRYYYIEGVFQGDVEFVISSFRQIYWVIPFEAGVLALFFAVVFPVVKSYSLARISSTAFFAVIIAAMLCLFGVPIYIRYAWDLPIVVSIVFLFETVRYGMKLVSFCVESCRDTTKPPTWRSCLYFLFVPTLIYQHSYPMREKRDWKDILLWSFESLILMWSTVVVLRGGFCKAFAGLGTHELTTEEWLTIVTQSCIMGLQVMLGIGYGFLHCWNNIWGELLYFGDRTFYKNFFDCGDPMRFLSKWNFLVHSWILEYLHKPAIRVTGNRNLAAFYSFIVSMLAHDLVVAVPLKIWSLHFTGCITFFSLFVPILVLIMDRFGTKGPASSSSNKSNIFFFFVFFMGITDNVLAPATKYFAQQNCPSTEVTLTSLVALSPDFSVCLPL